MKKINIVLFMFIIVSILRPLYGGTEEFRKIVEDYLRVNTIKAVIRQNIYLDNGTEETFSGNYFASAGGRIRIDYIQPESQSIVVNESGLFWYYNDRKILFLSEKKGDNIRTIPGVMNALPAENFKDIAIVSEGMKFYSFFKMAEVYSITSSKNSTRMSLWVDPVLKIIKRKYITDEAGREMIKEDYLDHALVDGVYIPSKIELRARTSSGLVHTVTEYSNIIINSRIDRDLFKFKITPEMNVRVLSGL